jgi:hypothetical protein
VLSRQVILHLLEAHHTGCCKEPVAVIYLLNRRYGFPRYPGDGLGSLGYQTATLREQPVDPVLQYDLIDCTPQGSRACRRVGLIEKLDLRILGIGQPKKLEVAVVLFVALQVGEAIGQ